MNEPKPQKPNQAGKANVHVSEKGILSVVPTLPEKNHPETHAPHNRDIPPMNEPNVVTATVSGVDGGVYDEYIPDENQTDNDENTSDRNAVGWLPDFSIPPDVQALLNVLTGPFDINEIPPALHAAGNLTQEGINLYRDLRPVPGGNMTFRDSRDAVGVKIAADSGSASASSNEELAAGVVAAFENERLRVRSAGADSPSARSMSPALRAILMALLKRALEIILNKLHTG